jgi:hypothetical protein
MALSEAAYRALDSATHCLATQACLLHSAKSHHMDEVNVCHQLE